MYSIASEPSLFKVNFIAKADVINRQSLGETETRTQMRTNEIQQPFKMNANWKENQLYHNTMMQLQLLIQGSDQSKFYYSDVVSVSPDCISVFGIIEQVFSLLTLFRFLWKFNKITGGKYFHCYGYRKCTEHENIRKMQWQMFFFFFEGILFTCYPSVEVVE